MPPLERVVPVEPSRADRSDATAFTAVLTRVCHFRAHDRGKPAFSGHCRQFDHTRVRV